MPRKSKLPIDGLFYERGAILRIREMRKNNKKKTRHVKDKKPTFVWLVIRYKNRGNNNEKKSIKGVYKTRERAIGEISQMVTKSAKEGMCYVKPKNTSSVTYSQEFLEDNNWWRPLLVEYQCGTIAPQYKNDFDNYFAQIPDLVREIFFNESIILLKIGIFCYELKKMLVL